MPGEPIRIRPATLGDARAIAEIHVRTWQLAYKDLLPPESLSALSVADRFRLWQRLLGDANSPVCALVAEIPFKVVGFCGVGSPRVATDQDPDVLELFTIYVEPSSQRQGIGARLLAEAEQTMQELGAFHGMLWVFTGNELAKSFYTYHGWTADGTVRIDRILGIDIQETKYRKILESSTDSPARLTPG